MLLNASCCEYLQKSIERKKNRDASSCCVFLWHEKNKGAARCGAIRWRRKCRAGRNGRATNGCSRGDWGVAARERDYAACFQLIASRKVKCKLQRELRRRSTALRRALESARIGAGVAQLQRTSAHFTPAQNGQATSGLGLRWVHGARSPPRASALARHCTTLARSLSRFRINRLQSVQSARKNTTARTPHRNYRPANRLRFVLSPQPPFNGGETQKCLISAAKN